LNLRYAILQRNPFPGAWEPIPEWQLHHAEHLLGLNYQHYHERAVKVRSILAYEEARARAIVTYLQVTYPWAEYQLYGIPGA
jgi:hypothetical protein